MVSNGGGEWTILVPLNIPIETFRRIAKLLSYRRTRDGCCCASGRSIVVQATCTLDTIQQNVSVVRHNGMSIRVSLFVQRGTRYLPCVTALFCHTRAYNFLNFLAYCSYQNIESKFLYGIRLCYMCIAIETLKQFDKTNKKLNTRIECART